MMFLNHNTFRALQQTSGGEPKPMRMKQAIGCVVFALSSLTMTGQQPSATTPVPQNRPAEPVVAPPSATTAQTPVKQQIPADSKTGSDPQPSSPPSSPATSGAAGVDNNRYIIGSEDSLQITVWREPTLSGAFPVRPDGMISMVLLGDLPASGLTPTQLSADISQRLRKFFQDPPSVTVQVMAVNSQRVYLMGEVGHVGPIALSAGMTPLQAIATAGGLSNFANSKHIYILRGTGASQQKIPFNYKQALKGTSQQQIVLRPGDTIVVP